MKGFMRLSMFLVFVLILIACSSNNSSTNSNTSSNPSNQNNNNQASDQPAKVEDVKPIVLKASTHSPPGALTDVFDVYLDEIEKRTDGRVTFERFYGGSLAGATDVVDAISSGVVDVAVINPAQQSGRLPLNTVTSNPALYSDSWAAIKTMNGLDEIFPELQAEWEKIGVVPIGNYATPPMVIMSTKSLSSYDDLKGLRILTSSRPIATVIGELGATPVGMPFNEAYEAVSRGTVDGIVISLQAALAFGINEIVDTAWMLPISGGPGFYGISQTVWDGLPEDIKEIIQDIKAEFQPESFYKIYQVEDVERALTIFAEHNVTIIDASEEDIQFLMDGPAGKVWSAWVEEMNGLGLPGQEVIDKFKELVEKYEKENPLK